MALLLEVVLLECDRVIDEKFRSVFENLWDSALVSWNINVNPDPNASVLERRGGGWGRDI